MAIILRRRKLGRTSVREIARLSTERITGVLHERDPFPNNRPDYTFRWGCTATLPYRGSTVVNEATAIHRVADKAAFRKTLADAGLAVSCWLDVRDWIRDGSPLPVIIRPKNHHQGRNLFHCTTQDEVLRRSRTVTERHGGMYISRVFNKTREYRVFVAQGRAICVANKTPGNPGDIAWNVAQGGRFDNVRWDEWDVGAVRRAIDAFNLSGLDFGGVDIMANNNREYCVLEINSAPSLTSPYRQECFAKVFDYIVRNGKATIPLQRERGGYRKFIHPAIINDSRN